MKELAEKLFAFSTSARYVYWLSLELCILFSLAGLIFPQDIYTDVANVYAYYARELGNGNFAEGWVSRVPMLQILFAGGLAYLGLEAFKACILLSGFFYILTVPVLRRYLEYFLTPLQAAWGCVLFVTAPKLIRYSISGMLESCRYFFLLAALLCFFRVAKYLRKRDAVLLGLALGGLAVSRGEAVLFLPVLLGFLPFYISLVQKDGLLKNLKRKALLTALSVFFTVIAVSPFCFGNLKYAGYFVTDARLVELMPKPTAQKAVKTAVPAVPAKQTSFAEKAGHALSELFRGGYEPYIVLGLLGMVLLLQRKWWRWEYSLLLAICLLHIAIYYKINSSLRYHLYAIPMLMPFTMTGIVFCINSYMKWKARKPLTDILLCSVVAAVIVFQGINGFERVINRKSWKRDAAEYLKEYNQKYFPGKRIRLADIGLADVVYYSGAYRVCNYKRGRIDFDKVNDFDLLLVARKKMSVLKRTDLVPVKHPFEDKFYLFTLTPKKKGIEIGKP